MYLLGSVIRFGEILTFWQNFKSLRQFLKVDLPFGKIVNLLWQLLCYWAKVHYCKWPNI